MLNSATSQVSCKYGAPMGRTSDHLDGLIVTANDSRFTLQHVKINSQGYDAGGAYWGIGQKLYWWSVTITEGDTTDECSGYFRAYDRDAAKARIRDLHTKACFCR